MANSLAHLGMRCWVWIFLLGDAEVPDLVDVVRPRGCVFCPGVPHVEDPHQARPEHVAPGVSPVGCRRYKMLQHPVDGLARRCMFPGGGFVLPGQVTWLRGKVL